MIKINCAALTDVGKIRSNNEDNYYVNGKHKESNLCLSDSIEENSVREQHLFGVFDGMGGESYGEVASLIAAKALKDFQDNFTQHAENYVEKVNTLICNEIAKNKGARIGTTSAILCINDNIAVSHNVGDSRIYLFRENALLQLSEDHTHAERLVKMGLITRDDARTHKDKNILTQCMGMLPDELIITPYISKEVEATFGDIFLLCSDGLTDMVGNEEIIEILRNQEYNSKELANHLVLEALNNGGKDNVTAVIVKVQQ